MARLSQADKKDIITPNNHGKQCHNKHTRMSTLEADGGNAFNDHRGQETSQTDRTARQTQMAATARDRIASRNMSNLWWISYNIS